MISAHGKAFKCLDKFWHNLRVFFYHHKTLFDITFLAIYGFEQFIFLMLILIFPTRSAQIVAVFIIAFLSTIGFERICMQSRYDYLVTNFNEMEKEYSYTREENHRLRGIIRQELRGKT